MNASVNERLDRIEAQLRQPQGPGFSDVARIEKAVTEGLSALRTDLALLSMETDRRFKAIPKPQTVDVKALVRAIAESSADAIRAERAATASQISSVKSGLGTAAEDSRRAALAGAEFAFSVVTDFAADFAFGRAH